MGKGTSGKATQAGEGLPRKARQNIIFKGGLPQRTPRNLIRKTRQNTIYKEVWR